MGKLKRDNDGITFLLTVIDVFSKQTWCVPLKNKSASSLVAALERLFADHRPTTLQTDKGLEFLNRSVQSLLKKHGIHQFSTHNEETKANIVERFNRTLKTRMWRSMTKHQTTRYIDALQEFVRSYNDTHHLSIGMAPSQVNAVNQEEVWQRLYGHNGKGVPKFLKDDRVCINKAKRQFKKVTWPIGAKKCSASTRFIPPIRLCTACSTISARCWTEPSTNRSYRKYRYRPINCTAWNRCCSDAKWANERWLW